MVRFRVRHHSPSAAPVPSSPRPSPCNKSSHVSSGECDCRKVSHYDTCRGCIRSSPGSTRSLRESTVHIWLELSELLFTSLSPSGSQPSPPHSHIRSSKQGIITLKREIDINTNKTKKVLIWTCLVPVSDAAVWHQGQMCQVHCAEVVRRDTCA